MDACIAAFVGLGLFMFIVLVAAISITIENNKEMDAVIRGDRAMIEKHMKKKARGTTGTWMPPPSNNGALMNEMKYQTELMKQQIDAIQQQTSTILSDSIREPLASKFDFRLTNVFRNFWDGIL